MNQSHENVKDVMAIIEEYAEIAVTEKNNNTLKYATICGMFPVAISCMSEEGREFFIRVVENMIKNKKAELPE